MRHLITALLCLLTVLTAPVLAERPRAGILWNRSGLPATFPLQVKTLPGKDYVVYLIDVDSGKPAMAGYIHGGTPFRLLVPPGRYHLRFAFGTEWQGEDDLFGTDTGRAELDRPLDFRAIGIGTRRGYLVTLIEQNGTMKVVEARSQDQCQITSWRSENREWPSDDRPQGWFYGENTQNHPTPKLRYLDWEFDSYTRLCV